MVELEETAKAEETAKEIHRLKLKANAQLECIKQLQEQVRELKDSRETPLKENGEEVAVMIYTCLKRLTEADAWMAARYMTGNDKEFYRIERDTFNELFERGNFPVSPDWLMDVMGDLGIVKKTDGRCTHYTVLQYQNRKIYYFRKSAINQIRRQAKQARR